MTTEHVEEVLRSMADDPVNASCRDYLKKLAGDSWYCKFIADRMERKNSSKDVHGG